MSMELYLKFYFYFFLLIVFVDLWDIVFIYCDFYFVEVVCLVFFKNVKRLVKEFDDIVGLFLE